MVLGCLGGGQGDGGGRPGHACLSLNGSCYDKCKSFFFFFFNLSTYLDDADSKKKKRKFSGPPEGGEPENCEAPTKGIPAVIWRGLRSRVGKGEMTWGLQADLPLQRRMEDGKQGGCGS